MPPGSRCSYRLFAPWALIVPSACSGVTAGVIIGTVSSFFMPGASAHEKSVCFLGEPGPPGFAQYRFFNTTAFLSTFRRMGALFFPRIWPKSFFLLLRTGNGFPGASAARPAGRPCGSCCGGSRNGRDANAGGVLKRSRRYGSLRLEAERPIAGACPFVV